MTEMDKKNLPDKDLGWTVAGWKEVKMSETVEVASQRYKKTPHFKGHAGDDDDNEDPTVSDTIVTTDLSSRICSMEHEPQKENGDQLLHTGINQESNLDLDFIKSTEQLNIVQNKDKVELRKKGTLGKRRKPSRGSVRSSLCSEYDIYEDSTVKSHRSSVTSDVFCDDTSLSPTSPHSPTYNSRDNPWSPAQLSNYSSRHSSTSSIKSFGNDKISPNAPPNTSKRMPDIKMHLLPSLDTPKIKLKPLPPEPTTKPPKFDRPPEQSPSKWLSELNGQSPKDKDVRPEIKSKTLEHLAPEPIVSIVPQYKPTYPEEDRTDSVWTDTHETEQYVNSGGDTLERGVNIACYEWQDGARHVPSLKGDDDSKYCHLHEDEGTLGSTHEGSANDEGKALGVTDKVSVTSKKNSSFGDFSDKAYKNALAWLSDVDSTPLRTDRKTIEPIKHSKVPQNRDVETGKPAWMDRVITTHKKFADGPLDAKSDKRDQNHNEKQPESTVSPSPWMKEFRKINRPSLLKPVSIAKNSDDLAKSNEKNNELSMGNVKTQTEINETIGGMSPAPTPTPTPNTSSPSSNSSPRQHESSIKVESPWKPVTQSPHQFWQQRSQDNLSPREADILSPTRGTPHTKSLPPLQKDRKKFPKSCVTSDPSDEVAVQGNDNIPSWKKEILTKKKNGQVINSDISVKSLSQAGGSPRKMSTTPNWKLDLLAKNKDKLADENKMPLWKQELVQRKRCDSPSPRKGSRDLGSSTSEPEWKKEAEIKRARFAKSVLLQEENKSTQ